MAWRNDLEIISHHATTGGVWAGDQIDKTSLRKLRSEGYIGFNERSGVYVLTVAGERTWARWRHIYSAWNFAMRIKWRTRKFLTQSKQ
jgi:DNA-binding PadR family transcriptional regulator